MYQVYCFCSHFSGSLKTIFSTLTTTTKSPVSTCGVYVGAVLAHEDHGDIAGQAADDLVRGIDQPPFGRQFARLGHVGLCYFHLLNSLPGKPVVYLFIGWLTRLTRQDCISTCESNGLRLRTGAKSA